MSRLPNPDWLRHREPRPKGLEEWPVIWEYVLIELRGAVDVAGPDPVVLCYEHERGRFLSHREALAQVVPLGLKLFTVRKVRHPLSVERWG